MNKLDSEEFYNLCQTYRHTPVSNIKETTQAFEAIKEFIYQRDVEFFNKELNEHRELIEKAATSKDLDRIFAQCDTISYLKHMSIPIEYLKEQVK